MALKLVKYDCTWSYDPVKDDQGKIISPVDEEGNPITKCPVCERNPTGDTYQIGAECQNCKERFVASIPLGHSVQDVSQNIEGTSCPVCAVPGHVKFGTTKQAEKLLRQHEEQ